MFASDRWTVSAARARIERGSIILEVRRCCFREKDDIRYVQEKQVKGASGVQGAWWRRRVGEFVVSWVSQTDWCLPAAAQGDEVESTVRRLMNQESRRKMKVKMRVKMLKIGIWISQSLFAQCMTQLS